ncbi:MAG TPA: alpha/beta fold hydrolase [Polyangia bacterium]|nr:alpha/beta fold hydrolase [Polyangia bacterium]
MRGASLTLLVALAGCMPPSWGAHALLHPYRRSLRAAPAIPVQTVSLEVAPGVRLAGWLFRTPQRRRGLVVYLHGLGDNRASGIGIARHFTGLGFDVLAYDGRAQGESTGPACTYGFYEKHDLSRALDLVGIQPVLVFGVSLGAAVGLQTAAVDGRIALVVAVAPFSDLRTAARERAPFFASRRNIDEAFRIAEAEAGFHADDVSPVAAAAQVGIPVLLVHGTDDHETPIAHSERIDRALRGPHELFRVPGAHHNDALTAGAWAEIDRWVALHWAD